MKNNTQHRSRTTAKRVLLLALLLAAATVAPAQTSFIREDVNILSDNSIIRQVNDTSWVIYSYYANRATFILATSNSPVVKVMDLGYRTIVINDFEVTGNTVYFCGNWNSFPAKAVLGKFSLSSFPYSPNIKVATVDTMMTFDKLDLMNSSIGLHMLMVGRSSYTDYRIVDTYEMLSPNIVFNIFDQTPDIADKWDDIAVTNEHVVVSGRNTNVNQPVLLYLDQPVPGGAFPNPSTATYLQCAYTANQPVWIKYCEDDAFATATISLNNWLYVSGFTGTTHISTQRSITNYDFMDCVDLAYNKYNRILDVLVHHSVSNTFSSSIYHLEPSMIYSSPSTVSGHNLSNYWLNSVTDVDPSAPMYFGLFLTTGFNGGGGELSMQRYPYTGFKCWEKKEIKMDDEELSPKTKEALLPFYKYNTMYDYFPVTGYEWEMEIICSTTREEDEE